MSIKRVLDRSHQAYKRRIWISVLRRFHPAVEVRVGDRRLLVDVRDRVIGSLLYLHGEYEATLQRLMRTMDLRGNVCLDIGANIGIHTVLMSELVGRSGRVFAFEPESHNFRLLAHNLSINKATNVAARPSAVGNKIGSCRLSLSAYNYGDHRVLLGSVVERSQKVPLTTIDSELRELPDGVVKFIKVDVQGYEYQVVQGMRKTLERNPDAILAIEVFPEGLRQADTSATELMRLLSNIGLDGWELHDRRILPVLDPWMYELFCDGHHVDVILSRNRDRLGSLLFDLIGGALSPSPSAKAA